MRNVAVSHCSQGVLWWRYKNALKKLSGWEFYDGMEDEGWFKAVLGGEPIDNFWCNGPALNLYYALDLIRYHFDTRAVVDIDDSHWTVGRYNLAWEQVKFTSIVANGDMIMKMADVVSCSTPHLMQEVEDRLGMPTRLAPNFVIPEDWYCHEQGNLFGDDCVLCMAGGTNRFHEYRGLGEAIRWFMDQPNTRIVVVGNAPAWLKEWGSDRVGWIDWVDVKLWPRLLRYVNPDIIVSPLFHDNFNKSKSNIKWLESAMVGACFVGERWGELERTVEEGKTGFLAEGWAEWADILVGLARDPDLRARTSQNARRVVESDWTWNGVGHLWKEALGVPE